MRALKILSLTVLLFGSGFSVSKVVASTSDTIELPAVPTRVIILTDEDFANLSTEQLQQKFPEEIRKKSNEAFYLLQMKESPTSEDIKKAIKLTLEAAAGGDPFSFEQLAYYALKGICGIPKNTEWAREVLFFLAQQEVTDARNSLTMMNTEITPAIRSKDLEKAKRLFNEAVKAEEEIKQ